MLEIGGSEPMEVLAGTLVNAAGLHAPRVATAIEGLPRASMPPAYYAKGNYYSLTGRSPFARLVYPMPNEAGLGVHISIDLGGQARFGPDVEWIDRIDYDVDPRRADGFYAAIRDYWPGLKDGQLAPGYAGIRPKIVGPKDKAADFVVQGPRDHGVTGLVNLYGIESPGLTAALAIADYVCELAVRKHPESEPPPQREQIVNREADSVRDRRRIGRHVGAFQDDRANLGVPREEHFGGGDEFALGGHDVERRAVAQKRARELAVRLDAHDWNVRLGSRTGEVLPCERRGVDRDHARPSARRQRPRDDGKLQETRCGERNAQPCRKLHLVEREEAASRDDGEGTVGGELVAGGDERVQKPGGASAHDALGRRAADDGDPHRERPTGRIARIARNARERGVEHQDAEHAPDLTALCLS